MRARRSRILAGMLVSMAATAWAAGPRRVISLGPSLTETVFALGCGDRVTGVGDYVQWPPEVRKLPRLGGLYNPSLERILALEPDLVLLPSPMPRLQAACRQAGVTVAIVPVRSLHGVLAAIERVAKLLHCPERGRGLAASISRRLAAVRHRTAGLPRRHVLLQVGQAPGPGLQGMTVAGGGTFLSDLAAAAGGTNVFPDPGMRYFRPSLESVVTARPEVVLLFDASAPNPRAAGEAARKAWAALLPPPRTPEVHVLTDQVFVLPGPRVAEAAEGLERRLHPEATVP